MIPLLLITVNMRNTHEFMDEVMAAFAAKAPGHHHLVFKAHPLEDYRDRPDKYALKLAEKYGLAASHSFFYMAAKLAKNIGFLPVRLSQLILLLRNRHCGVACLLKQWEQVFIRNLKFTSTQSLPDFFEMPNTPDLMAYRDYRRYLMATSQISGGFYSRASRVRLTRQAIDLVLSESDPYELLSTSPAAPMQQIKLIK
jgi:capsular polysaccharide export protein